MILCQGAVVTGYDFGIHYYKFLSIIVSVRGFNECLQPHNKLSWEDYCLALK